MKTMNKTITLAIFFLASSQALATIQFDCVFPRGEKEEPLVVHAYTDIDWIDTSASGLIDDVHVEIKKPVVKDQPTYYRFSLRGNEIMRIEKAEVGIEVKAKEKVKAIYVDAKPNLQGTCDTTEDIGP